MKTKPPKTKTIEVEAAPVPTTFRESRAVLYAAHNRLLSAHQLLNGYAADESGNPAVIVAPCVGWSVHRPISRFAVRWENSTL